MYVETEKNQKLHARPIETKEILSYRDVFSAQIVHPVYILFSSGEIRDEGGKDGRRKAGGRSSSL